MRPLPLIIAVAILVGGCGSASSSSPSAARSGAGGGASCGSARAKTLGTSSAARVFLSGRVVYGCAAHGSASYALGQMGGSCLLRGGRIETLAVAGSLAAYALERCGVDTGRTLVTVRRLTDGKVLASEPAITNAVAVESFQSVKSIALRSDGAVAWVATLGSVVGNRHATEIHKLDRGGLVLLDSGGSLDPGPLMLTGARLSWRHGGAVRSATLQ